MIQSDGFKENAENTPQIETLFEQYVKEMRFLRNFSERTLDGYKEIFKSVLAHWDNLPTVVIVSIILFRRVLLVLDVRRKVAIGMLGALQEAVGLLGLPV
jgi:hypothetical protein